MSSDPVLFQKIVTLIPTELKEHKKEMRDGVLSLTAHNLSFVQQHNKIAQSIPCIVVISLAISFFIRALSGRLPISDTFTLTFSWAAAIGMSIYCIHRLYQIVRSPELAFQLDIPLVSIAQLSEERLQFSRRRRIFQVKTYQGKIHRFATISEVADWVKAVGDSLQTSYERSLQFRRDGDIPTWQVKGQ